MLSVIVQIEGLSQKVALWRFGVFYFYLLSDSKFDSLWPVALRYSTEHKGAVCLVSQLENTGGISRES